MWPHLRAGVACDNCMQASAQQSFKWQVQGAAYISLNGSLCLFCSLLAPTPVGDEADISLQVGWEECGYSAHKRPAIGSDALHQVCAQWLTPQASPSLSWPRMQERSSCQVSVPLLAF